MPVLLCTVRHCRLPLAREPRRVVCPRGHSFDIARSGYINLLQPQERRSPRPGDSPQAVAARRRFLEAGHAAPLAEAMADMLPAAQHALDVGCGDGYYSATLAARRSSALCGVDISVPAIELAARRYPRHEWVVANADRFIPYADRSFDLLLSITGRLNAPEFRRLLRDDGALLVAVAAPDDLQELRGGRERDRVPRTIELFADFQRIDQRRATTVAALGEEDVRDILRATYRPRQAAARSVTLSLDLLLFRVARPARPADRA